MEQNQEEKVESNPTNLSEEIKSKINDQAKEYKNRYGKTFDESGYLASAIAQANTTGSFEDIGADKFLNEKSDDEKSDDEKRKDSDGNSQYALEEKDGKFIARGDNGKLIVSESREEMDDKICESFAKNAKAENREGTIAASYGSKSPEEAEKASKSFSAAAIKHGLLIYDGFSTDKSFWKNLKEDYLKSPGNSQEEWDRMTRKIPDEVVGRTKEENSQEAEKNLEVADVEKEKPSDRDAILALRYGRQLNDAQPALNATKAPYAPKQFDKKALFDKIKIDNTK